MKKFDESVLEIVKKIPKGKVITYKDIGIFLGISCYQAIGQVLKRNEKPIEIQCHRVVKSDGSLGGYLGSFDSKKEKLLKKEGIRIVNGNIDLNKFGYNLRPEL